PGNHRLPVLGSEPDCLAGAAALPASDRVSPVGLHAFHSGGSVCGSPAVEEAPICGISVLCLPDRTRVPSVLRGVSGDSGARSAISAQGPAALSAARFVAVSFHAEHAG